MNEHPIFLQSEKLLSKLTFILNHPLFDDSSRITASYGFCNIALEHGEALRLLMQSGLITSAIVVQRSQYEALVRAVWVLYAATDIQIDKLTADLSLESEQSAKNMSGVEDMLKNLEKNPIANVPYNALSEFKQYSWKALNSYVHAGIHPLRRTNEGYPLELIIQLVKISNALSVYSGMQIGILTGRQELIREIRDLHLSFADCLPISK